MTVFKEDELEEVQAEVQSFIGRWVKQFPEADKSILEFITTVYCHGGTGHSAGIIHDLFRAGFCYYFAKMLENAFPGGEVCWAAPYSHIVYNYNGICYDIEGIYMGRQLKSCLSGSWGTACMISGISQGSGIKQP